MPRPLASLALALCFAVTAASPAAAAPPAPAPAPATAGRRVEVPLRDGTTLSATPTAADEKGADVVVEGGTSRRLAWDAVAPVGVYRIRAALAKADDGPARRALADLASELGLFAEARAELERALALGALDAKTYEKAVVEAESRAIETGIARARRAADEGDVAKALEIARGLKLDFAGAKDAARVDAWLAELDAKIAARKGELDALQKDLLDAARDADRLKEVLVRREEAKKQMGIGDRAGAEMREQKQSITRARKAADAADEAYVKARKEIGRLRRITGEGSPERTAALALLEALDKAQFKLLLDAAKAMWDARVFNDAEQYAARASYIDPVDPTLLELRGEIREHRIRYRASDVTNARPR